MVSTTCWLMNIHDDSTVFSFLSILQTTLLFRFQNRRMKHKKDTSNVKSVNKPSKSTQLDSHKNSTKDSSKSPDDCHQDIVKRLMTHSQYFPSNPNNKPVSVSYSKSSSSSNVIRHYPSSYVNNSDSSSQDNQQSTMDNNNYSKDYFYHHEQQQQATTQGFNNQYSLSFSTCLSPSLLSPTNYHNFDQLSYIDSSPTTHRNDYIFNGEFNSSFNTDFDGSFPLCMSASAGVAVDTKTTPQLMDNQASEMIFERYADIASAAAQLTPLTIESQPNGFGIKNSFDDVKNNNVLVNLSDDDVLSNASYISRSPPSATVDWKFTD